MKRIITSLAMLAWALQAHAVQEVKLTDPPPLQQLHWCKDGGGQVRAQNETCGAGTTEVSSISQRQPDGHAEFLPLDKKDAPADNRAAADAPAVASADGQMDPDEKKRIMKDAHKRLLKWLGFALVVGIVAKVFKRSFILWFILGFILRMVLVAANVIAF